MKQYEVIFSNGAEVKGTKEQIELIAEHFEEQLHFSQSQNKFLAVKTMNFFHLENAVVKEFNDMIVQTPWQIHYFVQNNPLYEEWLDRVETQQQLAPLVQYENQQA